MYCDLRILLFITFSAILFAPSPTEGLLRDYRFLSKNVTHLLNQLLNKTRYDKRIRPGFGGAPVSVMVNLHIKSMGSVSETDESYSMDCYFRQTWFDRRLTYNFPGMQEFSLSWLILDRVWKPDTFFMNGKKSYLHRITVPNKFLRLRSDGYLTYSMRLTIKASCPMNLRKFPLDSQTCPLLIGSYGYRNNDVQYHWQKTNNLSIESNVELAQFDLVNVTTEKMQTLIRGKDEYSMIKAVFYLKRQNGFFMLQVYVPCGLIVCCSWVSFWIDPDAVPARVSLGVTTVLSMTTMGFGGKAQMPKVSYATALDWFVILCFTFVFAVMVEYAAINFIDKVTTDLKRVIEERNKNNKTPTKAPSKATADNSGDANTENSLDRSRSGSVVSAMPGGPADPSSPDPQHQYGKLNQTHEIFIKPITNLIRRLSSVMLSDPEEETKNQQPQFPPQPIPLITVNKTDTDSTGEEFIADDAAIYAEIRASGVRDNVLDIDDDFNDSLNDDKVSHIGEVIGEIAVTTGHSLRRCLCAPVDYWKNLRLLPREDDVLKMMASNEQPDKFSRIDIQARKVFPLAFISLLTIYFIAYGYYFTDEFPVIDQKILLMKRK